MKDDDEWSGEVEDATNEMIETDQADGLAKVNLLGATDKKTWYDVKCRVCGNRCCSPCTANGDINRCARTRFTNCSVCGHNSRSHYRVSH